MEDRKGAAAQGGWPSTTAFDLDDLLDELRSRAQASSHSQKRLTALLRAVMAMTAALHLPELLTRIVDCACELVDATHGALGVLGPDGEHLVDFVTHGLTTTEKDATSDLSREQGVLGLLIREPRPLRLAMLSDHSPSQGFPAHHPAMGSFVGTPVMIREQVFGILYLTDKIGAASFTGEDEAILVALAAAAGTAIDNARLYERSIRQREWGELAGKVRQMLLEGRDEASAMAYLAVQTRVMSGADLAVVALQDENGDLVIRAVDGGPAGKPPQGPSSSVLGTVLDDVRWPHLLTGLTPLVVSTRSDDSGDTDLAATILNLAAVDTHDSTALIPISIGADAIGVLAVAWGPDGESLVDHLMELLVPLSQQIALGLVAVRNQHFRAQVALLEDRDRIARDMHDHVIQRLFATGLSLQAMSRFTVSHNVRTRLEDAVEALDDAIKDIRHTIFELHRENAADDLREELDDLLDTAQDSLGFVPQLMVEGELSSLTVELEADLIAVVREALANVSRHARASRVQVSVVTTTMLTITVSDDGVGIDAGAARSGLSNLQARADKHGGWLRVEPNVPHGTVLTWAADIPEGATA